MPVNETVISFRRGGTNGVERSSVLYAPVYPYDLQMPTGMNTGWNHSASTLSKGVPWLNKNTKQLWVDGIIINPILKAGANITISDYKIDTVGSAGRPANSVYQEISATVTAFDGVFYVSSEAEAQSAYTGCGEGRSSSSPCYTELPSTGFPGLLFVFPNDTPCPTFVPLTIGQDPAYSSIEVSNPGGENEIALADRTGTIAAISNEKYTFQAYNKWLQLRGENSGTAGSDILKIAHSLSGVTDGTYTNNNSSANSIKMLSVTIDKAGHVTSASQSSTFTLPYYWNTYKALSSTDDTTDFTGETVYANAPAISPSSHAESVLFKSTNKWIQVNAIEGGSGTTPANQDRIDICHKLSGVTSGEYGAKDASNYATKVPVITVDKAGHITVAASRDIHASYWKIVPSNSSSSVSELTGNTTAIEATGVYDAFTFQAYNKWIVVAGSNSTAGNDVLSIAHKLSGVTAGQYGSATAIPKITVDVAGHITGIETVSVDISHNVSKNIVGDASTDTTDESVSAITNGNIWYNHIETPSGSSPSVTSSHKFVGYGDATIYKAASSTEIKFHAKPYEFRVNSSSGSTLTPDAETITNGSYLKLVKQDNAGSWSVADEKQINIDTASKPEMKVDMDRVVTNLNNDTGLASYEYDPLHPDYPYYSKNAQIRIKRNKLDTITLTLSSGTTYTYVTTGGSTPLVGQTVEGTVGTSVVYDVITAVSGNTVTLRTVTNLSGTTCELRNDDYIRIKHEDRIVSNNVATGSMMYFRKNTDADTFSNEDTIVATIVMIDGGEF